MTGAFRRLPAVVAIAGMLLARFVVPGPAAGADLGPHGGLVPGDAQGCRACHPDHPAATGVGQRQFLKVPPGGQERLGEPVSRFCWICHRPGNPYGARAAGRASGAPSHLRYPGSVNSPDSWHEKKPLREGASVDNPGFGRSTILSCADCHDVHSHAAPLFLRRTTPDGDYSALCADCHAGRVNEGFVGRGNILVRGTYAYSTHPANVPVADVPGSGKSSVATGGGAAASPVRCGSCHDVHQPPEADGGVVPGLLRLAAGETASDLCRRCHAVPALEDRTAHPMEGNGGGGFYPESFTSSEGVPRAWMAREHHDRGASGYIIMRKRPPRCTSCHDLHGGLPMTNLLYGPVTAAGGSGDWCFSCHAAEALTPADHLARAPGSAGRECVACHGAESGGRRVWPVHLGFLALHPAGAPEPEAVTIAVESAADRENREIVAELGRALLADREFERANAVDALVKIGSPLALDAAVAALADPRADVRENGARVLGAVGTVGGERAVSLLVGLLDNPVPEIRRTAVEALGKIGGEQATLALLPVLRDPSLELRQAAVAALTGVRDPRVYPPLIEVLWGSDVDLRFKAQDVLAQLNDARILRALLVDAPGRTAAPVVPLIAVINRLSDPAATEALREALFYDQRLVRIAAAEALRRYPGPGVVEDLIRSLESPDDRFRSVIVNSLGTLKDRRATEALLAILVEPREPAMLRRAAIFALARVAPPEAVPLLIEALGDPSPTVGEAALKSLVTLTCQNFGQERLRWREWWQKQTPAFPLGNCP